MASAAPRKRPNRNRKRKRRAASISSSSESSDDSDSSSSSSSETKTTTVITTKTIEEQQSSSSESESESESSSEDEASAAAALRESTIKQPRERSLSPGPIPPSAARIPSFLPESTSTAASPNSEKESEVSLREKFTKFWMSSIVEGFKDDLEVIRKDPTLTTSKLSMLIDSLAAGADVYTSSTLSHSDSRREVMDMDIVLGE